MFKSEWRVRSVTDKLTIYHYTVRFNIYTHTRRLFFFPKKKIFIIYKKKKIKKLKRFYG